LQVQAEFALAGGVLPTFNLDKLPVPLPHAYMLGWAAAGGEAWGRRLAGRRHT